MNFMTAVKTCFSKYVTFSGRAQRSEFWWFTLFYYVGFIVLSILSPMLVSIVGTTLDGLVDPIRLSTLIMLASLFMLAAFLPSISVMVRRLHDTDRSGWWYWIVMVPIIGPILLIVWWASKGSDGGNRFGADPLGGNNGHETGADFTRSGIPGVTRD